MDKPTPSPLNLRPETLKVGRLKIRCTTFENKMQTFENNNMKISLPSRSDRTTRTNALLQWSLVTYDCYFGIDATENRPRSLRVQFTQQVDRTYHIVIALVTQQI